jgi:hypothetical protein
MDLPEVFDCYLMQMRALGYWVLLEVVERQLIQKSGYWVLHEVVEG